MSLYPVRMCYSWGGRQPRESAQRPASRPQNMPSAEIITIGTEILLGEIVDTNTRYLARNLRGLGIDIYRTITIGDNVERIALAIAKPWSEPRSLSPQADLGRLWTIPHVRPCPWLWASKWSFARTYGNR